MYKKYLKGIGIFFLITLILSLTNTILYYFDITNLLITNIIKIISILLSSFITGFYIGKKSKNNGYINGLIQGIIIILIIIILNIFFTRNITFIFIITYIMIIIATTTGSIIGINKKK